jgi:hypothetical protein
MNEVDSVRDRELHERGIHPQTRVAIQRRSFVGHLEIVLVPLTHIHESRGGHHLPREFSFTRALQRQAVEMRKGAGGCYAALGGGRPAS